MSIRRLSVVWLSALCLILNQAYCQDFLGPQNGLDGLQDADPHVEVSLVSEGAVVVPGQSFWVAAKIIMDEGWHVYWENPGAAGAKPEIEWDLPEGFSAGEIQWPSPERHVLQGLMNYVYEDVVYLMVEIKSPAENPGETVVLKAGLKWTVCSDKLCMFGGKDLVLELPIGKEPGVNEAVAIAFQKTRQSWPVEDTGMKARALYDEESIVLEFSREPAKARAGVARQGPTLSFKILWMAFIGGAILNLMPCVFPVIGLKIMGFVNQAGESRKQIAIHGIVYTVGVLVSYWVLAGILIAVGAGGKELGWGFQLQEPRFVFVLTVVLFIFALNLSGLFEVGGSLMGVGGKLTMKGGLRGAFFSGVLATLVATPCAAPILTPALTVAIALPPASSLGVFTIMGLGLSLPYLLLSFFPQWVEKLPKPGPWMETFKQSMAFFLYGTVAYLLWTVAGQVDGDAFLQLLFSIVLVGLAGWIYGRWTRRAWARGMAAVIFLGGIVWGFPEDSSGVGVVEPAYEEGYFFTELALVAPSLPQDLGSADGKTFLRMPLAEYFNEEVKEANGRFKGVLFLKKNTLMKSRVSHLLVDAPMEKVEAGKLQEMYIKRESTGGLAMSVGKGLSWEPWSPDVARALFDEGKPVYIDFTARWCPTCQSNKRWALSSDRIIKRFAALGVAPLKADWTKKGPVIARALAEHGRVAVPFNVIYVPDGGNPIELPEVLTEGIVLKALSKVELRMGKLRAESGD